MMRIAFDIGGTFTDFVLEDGRAGALHFHKVPTTPRDPAKAVLEGLAVLLQNAKVAFGEVSSILHATTVATNAILERKGAKTALITTEGFRDIIIIGRQKRYDTYDMYLAKPVPLVRRRDIFEVGERVLADGTIERPLDAAALERVLERCGRAGLRVGRRLPPARLRRARAREGDRRASGGAEPARSAVSLSSDVSPKFREYERASTVVANAYIKPIVSRYVSRLTSALKERRASRPTSSSCSRTAGSYRQSLPATCRSASSSSGPAAGVLLCGVIGKEEGLDRVLTFDMGGTTAKLGAIDGGEPAITPTFEVDQVRYRKGSGLPINVPAVELLEIGAGGGSLAHTDMGLIKVGPESAGADPGPVCYGRGGTRPTVTDANVVLGYINPDYFNGGAMRLDAQAAADAIARQIGEPLGLDAGEAAWGIHSMANANMERAMRIVSVERGRDPRKYALVAFGGAGPLHAARLARTLGHPEDHRPVRRRRRLGHRHAGGQLQARRLPDAPAQAVRGRRGQIDDIYRQLECACAGRSEAHGRGCGRRSSRALPTCAMPGRATTSASICRSSRAARLRGAGRGPVRGGLPGEVRLSPIRSGGRGRGLVHRRLGRQRQRRRTSRQELEGRGVRLASAAARARPISRRSAVTPIARSSIAAPCRSARSSRDRPSSRRPRRRPCCCRAARPPSASAAISS